MGDITRPIIGFVVLLVFAVGSASAEANGHMPKSHHSARCVVPRGWAVYASDSRVLIIERRANRTDQSGTFVGREWRYCLRATGRFRDLVKDVSYSNGYGDLITVGQVILSGAYVAIGTTIEAGGGRYGCGGEMTLHDLSTGRSTNLFAGACGPGGVDSLLLNSRGFASWHMTDYPVAAYTPLDGVSCPSVSLCVAVDWAGNVLTSTNPSGGRDAWAITNLHPGGGPSGHGLDAISCASTQFCAAISNGEVLTSTDPTGGPSAWTATPVRQCPPCLTSISCPSASLCVAVDIGGNVVFSRDPTAGASVWTTVHVDSSTPWIRAVSCPSVSLCVAADEAGNVLTTTNPTGDASAWSLARVDNDPHNAELVAVSCPSTSLCVAAASDYTGGNLAVSTNPTGGAGAWTLTHVDDRKEPIGVACGSASLCIAFDYAGNVITSTDPGGGASAWTVTSLGQASLGSYLPPTAAACPSTSLCVAVSGTGHIATTTDPAAGGTAWSSTLVDGPPCAVSTPCAAEQIYAHDNHGTRVVDSAPPGSGKSLIDLQLNGDVLTWTHDGAPHQAQLG
jgi:hypothetical protein